MQEKEIKGIQMGGKEENCLCKRHDYEENPKELAKILLDLMIIAMLKDKGKYKN